MTSTDGWTYEVPNPADRDCSHRWQSLGFRIQCQWRDDALNEWVDVGVYKNLDDMAQERNIKL